MEIHNAIITDTMLGYEDHGILTFTLFIDTNEYQCCIGCYALDIYDREKKCRVPVAKGLDAIKKILEVVGVKKWEDLKGKYIRVKSNGGWGDRVTEIGNLMADKWFNMDKFFSNAEG